MKSRNEKKKEIKQRLCRLQEKEWVIVKGNNCIVETEKNGYIFTTDENCADFVAHSPSDIDWLVKRVEHLERLVYRYQRKNKI